MKSNDSRNDRKPPRDSKRSPRVRARQDDRKAQRRAKHTMQGRTR